MESVFKTLYDRQLDGMPCDQGAQPQIQGEKLIISHSECLHSNNWKEVGAPLDVMCRITGAWIAGFLKSASPEASYKLEESIAEGAGECLYCLSKV